ncbi:MAG: hypothetical protein M1834_008917 [Cirrosporium novae-zelandiae]|nr:MAG: hypothetical protein M1834_008917 [Cirrosporium novae-zelandiae]
MAEEIVYSASPLKSAVDWITEGGTRNWTFTMWTTAMHYPEKKTGMSGVLAGGNGIPFTIRHDWDANKHYHVNAVRGAGNTAIRRAYCYQQVTAFDTEMQAIQRYDTLTENINRHGDQQAAAQFMSLG